MGSIEKELVLESYKDIALGKGRACDEFFDELEERYTEMTEDETCKEETICRVIDKYIDLQRIKMANNGIKNEELEYQIKCTALKLSAIGVKEEDIKNITGGA